LKNYFFSLTEEKLKAFKAISLTRTNKHGMHTTNHLLKKSKSCTARNFQSTKIA